MPNPYASGRHVKTWEDHHGPVPDGYVVHHIDHDKSNHDISNLTLLTHKDHFAEHAEERGSDFHSKGGIASIAQRRKNPSVNTCEQCGEEFTTLWKARHCSDKCRDLWFRAHPEQSSQYHMFVCDYCGEEFGAKSTKKRTPRFCSRDCRNRGARGQSLRPDS